MSSGPPTEYDPRPPPSSKSSTHPSTGHRQAGGRAKCAGEAHATEQLDHGAVPNGLRPRPRVDPGTCSRSCATWRHYRDEPRVPWHHRLDPSGRPPRGASGSRDRPAGRWPHRADERPVEAWRSRAPAGKRRGSVLRRADTAATPCTHRGACEALVAIEVGADRTPKRPSRYRRRTTKARGLRGCHEPSSRRRGARGCDARRARRMRATQDGNAVRPDEPAGSGPEGLRRGAVPRGLDTEVPGHPRDRLARRRAMASSRAGGPKPHGHGMPVPAYGAPVRRTRRRTDEVSELPPTEIGGRRDAVLGFLSPSALEESGSHARWVCLTHLVAPSGFLNLSARFLPPIPFRICSAPITLLGF